MASIAAPGLAAQRIAASGTCTALSFGAPELNSAFLIFDAVQTADTASRKPVSSFIDPTTIDPTTGRILPMLQPQTLLCLVLLALIPGFLHRKGRACPGKWLLGRRVTGLRVTGLRVTGLRVTGLRVTGPAGLRREALRLAPLIIAALLALPATLLAPETLCALLDRPVVPLVGTMPPSPCRRSHSIQPHPVAALALVRFRYDVFPLRWKGSLRHDRLCATAVLRARKA